MSKAISTWKFLLVGITGDLSKKKILPGIAQFAKDFKDTLNVELYGYSRSAPDDEEIRSILLQNGQDSITNIQYIQGQYTDNSFFHSLVSSLKDNERLVVYLAVPPHVFVPFLQNSCPYSRYPINILIEKPFGTSSQEAEHILQIVQACDLGSHVHFCDHYMFKNGTFLPQNIQNQLSKLQPNAIQSITIQALESLGTYGRSGYYNETGALKDMFPHLYSLFQLIIDELCGHDDCNRFTQNAEVISHIFGQYQSYLADANSLDSHTDTYFNTSFQFPWYNNSTLLVAMESGKKLGLKKTAITLNFVNGDSVVWHIQPNAKVVINNVEYDILDTEMLDHNRTFQHLQQKQTDRFVSSANIITSWKLYEKIIEFAKQNAISAKPYKDNCYPISPVVGID